MSSNLLKRIGTSLILLIILFGAFMNQYMLFFFLTGICFVAITEIFALIQKIFSNQKYKIIIIYLVSILYLTVCFSQLFFYMNIDFNTKLLTIYLIIVCISTDVGGYIFGKIFKGKKLSKISPKKTYSGLFGSFILSLIAFFYFHVQFSYAYNLLILTFIISSISQLGDLFISYLKRKARVKDSGNILPGHGGILDRIDGMIFALPIGINLLFWFV